MKTFGGANDSNQIFVINHETNTIYNDVVRFDKSRMDEAIKNFNNYPKDDATVMIRGIDGQFLMKKGDD